MPSPSRDVLRAALRETLRDVSADKVLTPITRAMLLDPSFKGFEVPVAGWTPRPYDGWFHPSTHATWTERQLTLYLTSPELVEIEQMSMQSVLAVTQGHFFHSLLQQLWMTNGILKQAECPLEDPAHNRRGHMDGASDEWGLEIKTMNQQKLPKISDWESLKEKSPEYYAQTQDYLDMSGMGQMRYFIISTAYPYPIQEFLVPSDPAYQAAQRRKYRAAIDAATGQHIAPPCCALNSVTARACPVRGACEIGRLSSA